MLDVTKWPIFSLLSQDEVEQITKICVYGSSGNEAIFITASDDVYAIGSNCSGCLGLGNVLSSELLLNSASTTCFLAYQTRVSAIFTSADKSYMTYWGR